MTQDKSIHKNLVEELLMTKVQCIRQEYKKSQCIKP